MNEEKVEQTTAAPMAPEKKPVGEKAHRNMLVLFIVGVMALALMLWRVDFELNGLTHTLSSISEDVRSSSRTKPTEAAPKVVVVAQKVLKTKSGVLTFVQTCMGVVDAYEIHAMPFCVGENKLAVNKGAEKSIELAKMTSTSGADSPVLSDIVYVAGSENVLVSYGPNECETVGNCGAGQDWYHVNMAVDAATMSYRTIANFPKRGNVLWNAAGTKALVVADTCGGAGCGIEALHGYDLALDTLKDVTTEQAAAGDDATAGRLSSEETSRYFDVENKTLPAWVNVKWVDNESFTAQVRSADAKPKLADVQGKF